MMASETRDICPVEDFNAAFSYIFAKLKDKGINKPIILLLNGKKDSFVTIVDITEKGVRRKPIKVQVDETTKKNLRRKSPFLTDFEDDGSVALSLGKSIKRSVFIPLSRLGEKIGLIIIPNRNILRQEEIEKLKDISLEISDQIFLTVKMNRLRRRVQDLDSISEITKEMAKYDLDSLLRKILDIAIDKVNAVSGSLMLKNNNVLETMYAKGKWIRKDFSEIRFRIGEGAAGKVAETRKKILIENKLEDERFINVGSGTYRKNSYLGLPLTYKGILLGVINLDFKSHHELTDECIEFLEVLASHASMVVRNTQLYNEHLKKVKRLSAVYEITKTISATLVLEKVLDLIVKKIIKIVKADICSVHLLNKDKTRLVPKSRYNLDKEFLEKANVEVESSLSGKALKTKKIIYKRDISNLILFNNKDFTKKLGIKTFLSIPLIIDKEAIGVINIYSKKERKYTNNELELLSSFADQAAIAIEKAILYRHIKSDRERLSKILEISNEISSELNFDNLLHIILKRSMEITKAQSGALLVVNKDVLNIYDSIGYDNVDTERVKLKLGEGITGWVAKMGTPLYIDDVDTDQRYVKVIGSQRSEVALPININGKVFGVLNLDSNETGNFSKHKETLEILMDRISVAIENSWLHKSTQNFNEKLQEEVRIATKNLLEANKRLVKLDEIKSDFVSNVSHELRTPLTSILGYSKLMIAERIGPLNDVQKSSLKIIVEESERLTRLINDVLDLSKLEQGKTEFVMEKVDVNSLIDSIVANMKMLADEKGITITLQKEELPQIYAAGDKIMQVLTNLLSNAIKFTPEKGSIEITSLNRRQFIEVHVKDNGRGISPEDIPKLFNKFYQVDPSLTKITSGTGLGLSIAQHIVKRHGGKINVESKLKKGSDFWFTISKNLKIEQ